jgi:hypothetical protein
MILLGDVPMSMLDLCDSRCDYQRSKMWQPLLLYHIFQWMSAWNLGGRTEKSEALGLDLWEYQQLKEAFWAPI